MAQQKLASTVTDFAHFIDRGNVIDMAVGMIIGQAFSHAVSSLAKDIFSPFLDLVTTDNIENKFLVLRRGPSYPYASIEEAKKDQATVIQWGAFAQALVNFVLQAIVLYLVLRCMRVMRSVPEKLGRSMK